MTGLIGLNLPALWAAGQQIEENRQRSRLLDLQIAQTQQAAAQKTAQGTTLSTLYGGLDPATGISWDAPRTGLTTAEQTGMLASAFPEQFASASIKAMMPKDPKDYIISLGDGTGANIKDPNNPVIFGNTGLSFEGDAPASNLMRAAPTVPAPAPVAPAPGGRTIPTGPARTVSGEVPEIYRPYIEDAASAYGVDPEVLGSMLLKETAPGGPMTSRAGARGVMQFMPATAGQYGVDVNDPASSIDGAGRMMQNLLKKYGGDYRLAVGAYNWGEGNVDQWLAAGADPSKVPAETMDYVRKTVGTMTTGPNDDAAPAVEGPGGVRFALEKGQYVTKGMPPGYALAKDADGKRVAARIPGAPDAEARQREELELRRETERRQAEADRRSAERTAADTRFSNENTLRDEFNTLTKDFRTVGDAYSKIKKSAASETGAGDMSMLYSFVKLLDPGSVVRESEFATAAASGAYGERIQGAVQRVLTGERLPDSLRADFMREADNLFQSQRRGFETARTQYRAIAERRKVDPDNVVWDYTAEPSLPEPDPAAWQTVALPADVTVAGRQGQLPGRAAPAGGPPAQAALPPGVPPLPSPNAVLIR